jgi:hypothetical protein
VFREKFDDREEGKGRYVKLTTPSGAEVKNDWRCTSSPYMPSWSGEGKLYLLLSLKERTAMKFTDR